MPNWTEMCPYYLLFYELFHDLLIIIIIFWEGAVGQHVESYIGTSPFTIF